MSDITLRSKQQIIGTMIARIKALTDLTDFNPGSGMLTTVEAAAASDFSLEGKLLRILNLRNLDKVKGIDLENLAGEMGLVPKRLGAQAANVVLTVKETAFSKIASNVYPGDIAPAAGDTTLKIVDASAFKPSGKIYIGRGTKTSEIANYVSITLPNPLALVQPYYILNLSAPLVKDHLVGEEVVLAQGGDRTVSAGATASIPTSAGGTQVSFRTTIANTLLDGEDTMTGVAAIATLPGSQGNVGINQVTQWSTAPWSTAAVSNPNPATGGRDPESDDELRQRVKDHVHELGRGTGTAIKRAVIGVTDPDQGNRVVSAFLQEPTDSTQPGILYIDDGTGFAPTFSGTGEEVIVTSAVGTESYFQLQNWPVAKAQIATVATEPFNLSGGESLYVEVDGTSEQRALPTAFPSVPGSATAQEVAQAINATFTSIEARAKNGVLFVSPIAFDPEYIRIGTPSATPDANAVLRFPATREYTIRLYQNDRLMEKNGADATVQTISSSQWPPLGIPDIVLGHYETLQLTVDGILGALVTMSDLDFATYTSSSLVSGASAKDWATVINKKFIGVTATALDDGTFTITSNRGATNLASLAVTAGTLATKIFPANASAVGKASEFKLNRLLGQIQTTARLNAGDELKAGTKNTRGFDTSNDQPTFNTLAYIMPDTSHLPAQMVLVTDDPIEILSVDQTQIATFTTGTNQQIISCPNAGTFSNVETDDWMHSYGCPRSALLRVQSVTPDGKTVTLFDPNPVAGSVQLDGVLLKTTFFRTDAIPQLINLPDNAGTTGAALVAAINADLAGGEAVLNDDGSVTISTFRFNPAGALGVASLGGNAATLGFVAANYQSNDPHTAAIESADLIGTPSKRIVVGTAVSNTTDLQASGTPFTDSTFANRSLLVYLGSAAKQVRHPQVRLSTSELTLRTRAPFQPVNNGTDLHAATMSGVEFGQADNMVFLIDNDPATKTFSIPMYVDAVVSAPASPSRSQFDMQDTSGSDLAIGSRWTGYDWTDYRVWLQAMVDIPSSYANANIRIRSNQFGPNGSHIAFGFFYPSSPTNALTANLAVDSTNDAIQVNVNLASGVARSISLSPSVRLEIADTGAQSGYPQSLTAWFQYPVTLASVLVGDIANFSDPALNAANLGSFKVISVNNLVDLSKSWQFVVENFTSTVAGATGVTLSSACTKTLRIGDEITVTGTTKQITVVTAGAPGVGSITVQTGGDYAVGGGTITVNSIPVIYGAYNVGTGVFSNLNLDPSLAGITVGQQAVQLYATPVTNLVTAVTSQSVCTVAGPGFDNASGLITAVTHKNITASAAPSFTVAVGDKITVAGQYLTVTNVIDTSNFDVNTPFAFTGNITGNVSRINLVCGSQNHASAQVITTASSSSVVVMDLPAASNTSALLIALINSTTGVNTMVTASATPGYLTSGSVLKSTYDETGSPRSTLQNSESYVQSVALSSPGFTLKEQFAVAPAIGDKVRLVPQTPINVANHFSKKQISGLTVAADVELIDNDRRVQISSQTPGSAGSVLAVGGTASGQSIFLLRGTTQQFSSTRAQIELDRAAMDLLTPGNIVVLSQAGRTSKTWPVSTPGPTDTLTIAVSAPGVGLATVTQPVVSIYSFTHTGSVVWMVRNVGRNRWRYEVFSGTATIPAGLQPDDWVLVGNGENYAGTTPLQIFTASNQGWFQVRGTDNSTYFDVENPNGGEDFETATSAPFLFATYNSARIGDQIVIGPDVPVTATANKGTFTVTSVASTTSVKYTNPSVSSQSAVALGTAGSAELYFLDQGFTTHRKVIMVCPKPSDPTNRSLAILSQGSNISLLNVGAGARLSLPNRLGYGTDPVPGMDGYEFWTGLKQLVQRTVDGYEPDSANFEGVRASGAQIEVREPQIQRVTLSLTVKTTKGVALLAISDSIKSAIAGYINSLGLGQDVVLSEVISIAQVISGVDSLVLVSPTLNTERITINSNAIAKINTSDITLQ